LLNAYHAEHWHEAFVMLGGASAALAGLIIVAVSVRADQLIGLPQWWLRARNNTLSMISLTVGSFMVMLPQSPNMLGVELVVLNLLCAVALPGRLVFYHLRNKTDASIHIPVIAVLLYLVAAIGGASLILREGGGLFWLAAAYAVYLFLAPYNAYLLLLPHKRT